MNLPKELRTISKKVEFKLREKGSTFIAYACTVSSEEEAQKFLNLTRKKNYNATHNCYAYKLVNGKTKFSDDGEPNGTAGIRILNSINHFDLTDIIIVVTRYFGGIKLGIGPLGKSYADCSLECLKSAKTVIKILYSKLTISFDFELSNFVHRTLTNYKAKIEDTTYTDKPNISCFIMTEVVEKVMNELIEASQNKVSCTLINAARYFEKKG